MSPTRTTTPLPRRAAVKRGQRRARLLALLLGGGALASVTSCPSAATTFAGGAPPAAPGLLEPAERVDDAVGAGQQPERGVVGERGQRQRRLAVLAGARAATGSSRAPNGSIGVGCVGCVRRSAPERAPRAACFGAEARQPAAVLDVAPQPPRAAGAGSSAAGRRAATPSRSVARGSRERASAMSEVRS